MTGQQRRTSGHDRQPAAAGPPDLLPVQRTPLNDLVERFADDFAAILPKSTNVEAFVGLAVAYVRRDKTLAVAAFKNQLSLIVALRECAALGHMPQKGVAALVPYQSNKDGDNGWTIQLIEEVGGVKQRIMRAGGVTALVCDVVREKDRARYQRTTMAVPFHEYDEFADPKDRGPLKAVYAYGILLNGAPSTVVWMPKATVMKHRAMSRTAKRPDGGGFWGPEWPDEGPWTEDMWKKTALHKLADDLPATAEYRWQMAASEAAASQRFAGAPDTPATSDAGGGTDRVWEGEFREDEPAPAGNGWEDVKVAEPGGQK